MNPLKDDETASHDFHMRKIEGAKLKSLSNLPKFLCERLARVEKQSGVRPLFTLILFLSEAPAGIDQYMRPSVFDDTAI